jgi:hypothetical protein
MMMTTILSAPIGPYRKRSHGTPMLIAAVGCLVLFTPRVGRCDPAAKVTPVGPDTFELVMPIRKSMETDTGRALDQATRQAANYCARMKRTPIIRDSSVTPGAPTRLTFSCVPND